jgi:hypothetical protein
VLKSSQAINHVNVELKPNISEISSVSIIRVNPDDEDEADLWNIGFWFNIDTADCLRRF